MVSPDHIGRLLGNHHHWCVGVAADNARHDGRIHHTQALQRFADQTAHEELLRTQRSLEAVLRRGDGSGLDGTLSELGLNPAITHAALVDDAGVVLAALSQPSDVPPVPPALRTEALQVGALHDSASLEPADVS